jgi:cell division protein FtsI (penicillin-binding protein 3)
MNGRRSDFENVYSALAIPVVNGGVPADWVTTVKSEKRVKLENRIVQNTEVPNVMGMGLRDALFLLENCGFSVKARGKGVVKYQSVAPGTEVSQNKSIIIELG